ncbi:hypothetical protein U9M48_044388 [Paspalum notatum var. saurae]|uniref:Uncharacterized protein n=1 Tax=Paspalum notatum var. saurae TaxID=547442 RepID=A0AAQ3UVJ3_PASNO
MELAGLGARRLTPREEELLGLLAGFPDGECGTDRELSFSDLVEAGARPGADADADHHAPREEDRPGAAAAAAQSSSPGRHAAAASKQQRRQLQAARQRARRSGGSRGSCGGSGDGVLLNFYVPPGLLTRSMTAPRPGRGPPSPGAGQGLGAPAKAAAAAGKPIRTQSPLGIGCWPALWGRGRERRRPAKACS